MKKYLFILVAGISLSLQSFAADGMSVVKQASNIVISDGGGDWISDFNVYPNPTTNGYVSVEFDNVARANVTVRIYNMIGNEIYNEKVSSADVSYKQTIYLGDLPKGVYVLEVSDGTRKVTKRLSSI